MSLIFNKYKCGCWKPFGQRLVGTGDLLGNAQWYWRPCEQYFESSRDIWEMSG
jgi:hypothetical protein